MHDFSDQVALVTGASRGIGRKVAEELASHGAAVILASRSEADIESAAEEIRHKGGEAMAVQMDVGQAHQVEGAVARIGEHFKKVDILVNNAGIARDSLLIRMEEEEWNQVLTTNLDGAYYVTRKVVTGMIRQRYGRVINITSVVAQMGNPGQVNYVASKAGIIGFTKALAREVASRNITVNAVAPGLIQTDMTAKLGQEVRDQLQDSIPLKRLGTVEDVACGVLFLAAKEAGYITGHVLNINGGMYM
ncbi:3-oxoacyl-[acyl-carrier-protein] reductase [Acidobacteria bacterium AH-259-D05]|nr:3-oxoacyl-[acyl-carrier-protein] reductase [Acidobacteria bacterium AH-259-D05]